MMGQDEFDSLYDIATGKQAPQSLFFGRVFPNSHRADDPQRLVSVARFDKTSLVQDPDRGTSLR